MATIRPLYSIKIFVEMFLVAYSKWEDGQKILYLRYALVMRYKRLLKLIKWIIIVKNNKIKNSFSCYSSTSRLLFMGWANVQLKYV